ncbi:MAG: hypothetical protein WBA67_16720 [Jannaschia sp.]
MPEAFSIETLKNAQFLIGFIVSLFMLGSGIVFWVHRRMKAVAEGVSRDASAPYGATLKRVEKLEQDVHRISEDVSSLLVDQRGMDKRMGRIETVIEGVARKEDLSGLSREFAEFRGTVTAENKQIGGMVHSIHAAILRQSSNGK